MVLSPIPELPADRLRWEDALYSDAPSAQVKSGVELLRRIGGSPILATSVPVDEIGGDSFAALAGVDRAAATNCILVVGTRGKDRTMAALLLAGGSRADLNGRVRKILGARQVSFADTDEVRSLGMEKGAVGPIGLPLEWTILIDDRLRSLDVIYCGGGALQCKLMLQVRDLVLLPQASFASIERLETI